jgi:hypothetical protein
MQVLARIREQQSTIHSAVYAGNVALVLDHLIVDPACVNTTKHALSLGSRFGKRKFGNCTVARRWERRGTQVMRLMRGVRAWLCACDAFTFS